MGIPSVTRRLAAAIALAALALAAAPAAAIVIKPGPGVRVRKEINSLTPLQIEAFRAGVARMQARPASDPTSWVYQANIHGYLSADGICPGSGSRQPAWGTCTHGTFFFLPWHRMYLHFFERILRKAVREALGDPTYEFALPYWDYQLHPELPAPLRVPADASNPLYVQRRAVACNAGLPCVPPPISSSAVALGLPEFCDCPTNAASCIGCERYHHPFLAFGSRHSDYGNGHGQLEFQPHDLVHVVVGGVVERGWMGYVQCAARDPVFYLHHGNIDRLWQVWLNLGLGLHANPLENDDWKHREFVFFDENGQQVTMTGCDVLDTAAQLDYAYDGVPVQNVVRCEDVGAAGGDSGFEAAAAFEEPEILGTSEPVAVELGNTPVTVTVPLSEEANQRILAVAGAEPGRVLLDIADIEVLNAGAVFGVYLEVPAGQTPDPQGPHFAGNLGIFVDLQHQHPQSRGYDITEEVQALYERSRWSAPLSVTFVRATGQELGDPPSFLRIGQISVAVH